MARTIPATGDSTFAKNLVVRKARWSSRCGKHVHGTSVDMQYGRWTWAHFVLSINITPSSRYLTISPSPSTFLDAFIVIHNLYSAALPSTTIPHHPSLIPQHLSPRPTTAQASILPATRLRQPRCRSTSFPPFFSPSSPPSTPRTWTHPQPPRVRMTNVRIAAGTSAGTTAPSSSSSWGMYGFSG